MIRVHYTHVKESLLSTIGVSKEAKDTELDMKNALSFIPNMLTLLNLSCGVLAIIFLDLFWSPILILIAGIFDLLDGAVARALDATSPIGKELDSLCDMVSFGLAPALIYWLLVPDTHFFWYLVPIIITAGAAWRLATFNTLPPTDYFLGLASPASALCLIGLALGVYWGNGLILTIIEQPIGYAAVAVILSWSMNRKRVMLSAKGFANPSHQKWLIAIGLGIIILFVIDYTMALPLSIFWYMLICEIRAWTNSDEPG